MPDSLIQDILGNQSAPAAALKKTLDAQAARQRAHAQNIANAETPGYRRVSVGFENQLKEALKQSGSHLESSDPRHLQGMSPDLDNVQPFMTQEESDPNGPGVNGVNIDMEMAEMAETQLRYMTALELLKRRYAGLKSAIRGQP